MRHCSAGTCFRIVQCIPRHKTVLPCFVLHRQASSTSERLASQGRAIGRAGASLTQYVGMVPGVQTLMKRIADRKTRDSTVLALVIAACLCFTIWYLAATPSA